jgi:hypothetical protein
VRKTHARYLLCERGHSERTAKSIQNSSAAPSTLFGSNRDGAAIDPAKLAQARHEGIRPRTKRRSIRAQEPDDRCLARLLRSPSQRPSDCRAAECGNELPPCNASCHLTLARGSCPPRCGKRYHAPIGRSGLSGTDGSRLACPLSGVLRPRLRCGVAAVHDPKRHNARFRPANGPAFIAMECDPDVLVLHP